MPIAPNNADFSGGDPGVPGLSPRQPLTKPEDRVPFREKLALGVGSLAGFFGYVSVNTLAYPVYNMILGVNVGLVGLALMVPRIYDAFIDPYVGNVSDNFRSRFGRRRPFIVVGAILMGLTFGLIWMVPDAWPQNAKIGYFIALQILYFTCYAVFSVPYGSLTYEMTPDYYERTRVMSYCAFFHKSGEFLYQWLIPIASLAVFGTLIHGVQILGWVVGLGIMAGLGILPGLFVRERFQRQAEHQEEVKLLPSIRQTFKSRAFVVLTIIVVLNTMAGVLAQGIDHYILVYFMAHGDIAQGSIWKGLLSSGYAVVGFASIPLIAWLGGRFGKRGSLYFVYALTVVGGVAKWFIFRPGHPMFSLNLGFGAIKLDPIILLDPLLCGPMWVAVKIMLSSMMADICDADELRYGARREGLFSAVFAWVEKSTVSLSFLGTGIALGAAGFRASLGGAQSPETFTVMRLFLAAAPTITAAMAIVVLRYYPLTVEQMFETRRQLEARRGKVGVPRPATS